MIEIETSNDRRVQTWWLSRPEARNAVNLEMWRQLHDAARTGAKDPELRVVVIRGRGANFCAGADITGLGRALASDDEGTDYRTTNAAAERAIVELPVATIAAIDGFCIGGGVQLALACDIRVATPRASFAITPAKLGISYPASGLRRLVAIAGVGVASELLLTADTIDAPRAERVGIVSRVEPDLDTAVDALVTTLAERSSITQHATKELLGAVIAGEDVETLGKIWESRSLSGNDLAEGLLAFSEKRAARFGSRTTGYPPPH